MKQDLKRIGVVLPAQGYPEVSIVGQELEQGIASGHFSLFVHADEGVIDPEVLAWRIHEIQTEGVWNFFWFQNFGPRLMNHWWGLLVCQGKYEETVRTFLFDTGAEESKEIRLVRQAARQVFDDPAVMARIFGEFPEEMKHELAVVGYLGENPKDYVGALNAISDEVQYWMDAYGYFLYNRVLSWCLELGGECAESLPWAMSSNDTQRGYYAELFEIDEVPQDFQESLRSFPMLQLQSRVISTKFFSEAVSYTTTPEGIKISFELRNGGDPLVLLSHLFEVKIIPEKKEPRE